MRARALSLLAAALLILAACGEDEEATAPEPAPETVVRYTPAPVTELPGWDSDDVSAALPAWQHSCRRIASRAPEKSLGPAGTAGDWQPLCLEILALPEGDDAGLREFIATNFTALFVDNGPDEKGLFTGYYEPIIAVSPERTDEYAEPVYALPRDHVSVRLGDFDPALKGKSIVGRVDGGSLVPYRKRGEIDAGAITDQAEVLYWARDPLDLFILQVQGSGVAEMPDGTRKRIGFAGHNGHAYGSLGRYLIETGELKPGRASWGDIRAWLEAHPDKARDALAVNARYIFFRAIDGAGPMGAAGVPLTAGRSLAVDTDNVPLNVPVWLDAEDPDGGRLQRLMLAQDVGSAIKGVVRGDFYWGTGDTALAKAGRMKSAGRYWILVPKGVAPAS